MLLRGRARADRARAPPTATDRRRHHLPAVGDERIASPLEVERRLRADVAVPDVAVVADGLDRLVRVVVRHAELAAEIAAHAEQALHVGVLRALLRIDVGLRDAELFGRHERIQRVADEIFPARLSLRDDRPDRLVGHGLREHLVVIAIGQLGETRGEARPVVDQRVAALGDERVPRLFGGREGDDLVLHLVRAEVARDDQLRRAALQRADRRIVEVGELVRLRLLRDDEALAVVEHDLRELEAAHVAALRPREAVREHVDHAGGQAGERGFEVHRRQLDLRFVAERSRRDRLAEIDVEAFALARVVLRGKAGRRERHPALDDTVRLDVVEDVGACGARQRGERGGAEQAFAGDRNDAANGHGDVSVVVAVRSSIGTYARGAGPL
jgi:hypothetical protein